MANFTLRIIGIFFDNSVSLEGDSFTVRDVMQAAMDQSIEDFKFEPGPDGSLKRVSCLKADFISERSKRSYNGGLYEMEDNPDFSKPIYTTWQSYLTRKGQVINKLPEFELFGDREVLDGDIITWRLVSVRSGPEKRYIA